MSRNDDAAIVAIGCAVVGCAFVVDLLVLGTIIGLAVQVLKAMGVIHG